MARHIWPAPPRHIWPSVPKTWGLMLENARREQLWWAERDRIAASPVVGVGCTGMPIHAAEVTARPLEPGPVGVIARGGMRAPDAAVDDRWEMKDLLRWDRM